MCICDEKTREYIEKSHASLSKKITELWGDNQIRIQQVEKQQKKDTAILREILSFIKKLSSRI